MSESVVEYADAVERDDEPTAHETIGRIYAQSETVKRRELDDALRRFEAAGESTGEQHETITRMADAIVASLVSVPARTLRRTADEDDETRRAVRRLFGPDA
jgi:glutamyl-tRNA reductase